MDYNFQFISNNVTPYEIRCKGLRESLSKKEFSIALYHLVKRRGATQFSSENPKEDSELKETLAKNHAKLSQDVYVCDVQYGFLKNDAMDNKVRGSKNFFYAEDYLKEFVKLVETQSKYLTIPKDFVVKARKIMMRKRLYHQGPGNPSPFGWGATKRSG